MITHSVIVERLAELRTTAEAAAEDEARGVGTGAGTSALHEHGQNWSPAHSLRWLSWAEQVAAEHTPVPYYEPAGQGWACSHEWADGDGWRTDWRTCSHVVGLIAALGLEETP